LLPDSFFVVVVGADLLQAQKQLLMSHLTCSKRKRNLFGVDTSIRVSVCPAF
jgi:hypothetical protein